MTLHTLEPSLETLHGHFSRRLSPVLTVEPGDTVRYRTLDAAWNVARPAGQTRSGWPTFPGRDPLRDPGHALVGPVRIRGAQPGMTLVIDIGRIEPGAWGFNSGVDTQTTGDRRDPNSPQRYFYWDIDAASQTARNDLGQAVRLRPFMGVLGMPPAAAGLHSTIPPRRTGGNIDCKELVSGSTLYLPIEVAGGLFSVGDGHAVQADGEVSGTAIECPIERVDLTFDLRDDLALETPRAHTPVGWLTFGFDPDLNQAYDAAKWAMIDLMTELYGIGRLNALSLASLIVDMRVTQSVNGVKGVHAVLPHDSLL